METTYSSLAELRSELTADNPDERANAYGAVMGVDVQPSQVLGNKPEEDAVTTLVEAGVVPEQATEQGRPKSDRDEEMLAELQRIADIAEEIAANTGGN